MPAIATIEQIRHIETKAAASGIAYDEMMQRAGRAVADLFKTQQVDLQYKKLTVLVGKGNNGGDGLLAGLFIAQDFPDVLVRFYLLEDRPNDPYLEVARAADLFVVQSSDDADKRVLRNMIHSSDLIIDALFGIGVRLPLREEAARVLRSVNQVLNERRNHSPQPLSYQGAMMDDDTDPSPPFVWALDCPSGVDCDTGRADKNVIPAHVTLTFIAVKPGLLTYPAAESVGELFVAPLNLPIEDPLLGRWPTLSEIRPLLPKRPSHAHKGTFGKLLIIGGCARYLGAPRLSAEAAYRSGAGLVTIASTQFVCTAMAASIPEATWHILPDEEGFLGVSALSSLTSSFATADALLLGVGLGNTPSTQAFLTGLSQADYALPPTVFDADALNGLATLANWWQHFPQNNILTPHPAEMARLCKLSVEEVQAQRLELAQHKAHEWQQVVLLKGAHTIIAAPDGRYTMLPFKNPTLAKAGSGDVLGGIIAALLAQGLPPYEAAYVGAFLHGASAHGLASPSINPTDLIQRLGRLWQSN